VPGRDYAIQTGDGLTIKDIILPDEFLQMTVENLGSLESKPQNIINKYAVSFYPIKMSTTQFF